MDCYIGKSITQIVWNIYVYNAYKFSMLSTFEIGYPRTTCHLRSKFIESYFRKSGSHTRIEWRQISIIFALKGHVSLRRNFCQMEWYLYHRSRQVMIWHPIFRICSYSTHSFCVLYPLSFNTRTINLSLEVGWFHCNSISI